MREGQVDGAVVIEIGGERIEVTDFSISVVSHDAEVVSDE